MPAHQRYEVVHEVRTVVKAASPQEAIEILKVVVETNETDTAHVWLAPEVVRIDSQKDI